MCLALVSWNNAGNMYHDSAQKTLPMCWIFIDVYFFLQMFRKEVEEFPSEKVSFIQIYHIESLKLLSKKIPLAIL